MEKRLAEIHRQTKETDINCELNLDGVGKYEMNSSIKNGCGINSLRRINYCLRYSSTLFGRTDLKIPFSLKISAV